MAVRSILLPDPSAPPLRPNWWRLGAAATLRFAEHRGWRPTTDNGGAPWIGREWNGRSNIRLGSEIVASQTVEAVLAHLRRGIAAHRVRVARLPDRASVRCCWFCGPRLATIVIDVDFGEFILPVSITESLVARHSDLTAEEVAVGMIDIIVTADAVREQIGALDLDLRNAVVEQSMVAAVTPLWLRMPAWHFNRRYEAPLTDARELTVLMLDQNLRPVISGLRSSRTVAGFTHFLGFHGKMQRRRAVMRAKLDAAGSAGFVTDVARGLIEARGMDPIDVLTRLRASCSESDHEGISHRTDTTFERLTFTEGLIEATIVFAGGNYRSGKLTLNGNFPATLAMAAKGRPLTAFVDHPAFRAAGVTIGYGRALRGRLRLYHKVRSLPVEEVARKTPSNEPSPF